MLRNTIELASIEKHILGWLAAALMLTIPLASTAEVIALPPDGSDLVGEIRYTKAKHEDTLIDIAREFSVGQDEIVMANPTVDRWMPGEGKEVLIPRQFILPDAPRSGVVVNIPEMRLYYYPTQPKAKATQVITYPVSIGRMDWRTPLGGTKIAQKVKDPTWTPPESIKKEHAQNGDILPDVVPAGPMNPLGRFAMRLGVPGYLIHGTGIDKAYGIGMRVTHGCIRMYPEDIERLYPLVNVGTAVHLVNQPVKLGWSGGALYMEVHQPLDEDRMTYEQLLDSAMDMIQKKTAGRRIVLDGAALKQALQQPTGIPVVISKSLEPISDEPAQIPEPAQDLGGT
ncbi:L,D-transpeptidase family protein [Methylocaldum sp. MU1018]